MDARVPRSEAADTESIITVLVPTYNRLSRLQKAVESVLQESRVPIRLCIFDNASSDETQAYSAQLAARDPRVSYHRNAHNIGAIANYTLALASVQTDYFVPLADDDWLLPNFLFDAHGILRRHSSACAAVFVTEGRDESGNLICTYPSAPGEIALGLVEPAKHLRDFMTHSHYGWSAVLWRRHVLDTIGAPYFHVGLPSDVDMQLQVFSRFPAYVVDKPGAVYLMHAAQYSQDYGVTHARSWARMFQRLDRVVLGLNLFTLDEYLPLRQAMASRYRDAWTTRARAALSRKAIIGAACAAGFRLGDWEFAFGLLDHLPEEPKGEAAAPDDVVLLPTRDMAFGTAQPQRSPSSLRGAMEAVLLWMRASLQAQNRLSGEQAALAGRLEDGRAAASHAGRVLETDLAALRASCALAQQQCDALRARVDRLARQLDAERAASAVLQHRLGEAQLLGSLRYVPRRLLAKLTGRPVALPGSAQPPQASP